LQPQLVPQAQLLPHRQPVLQAQAFEFVFEQVFITGSSSFMR